MKIKRAEWFENKIAYHLVKSNLDNGRSNGLIRGSSIGSKCLRSIGYMVLGYQEQVRNAHSVYVLNFGNAFHDLVQTWMSKMGIVQATPYLEKDGSLQWKGDAEGTILDLKDGIIGHYDGLTQPLLQDGFSCGIDSSGKRYLLEFKTISNKSRVHAIFLEDFGEGEKNLCTVKYTVPPGSSLYSQLNPLEGSPPKSIYSKGNERYLKIVEKEGLGSGDLIDVIHKPGAFSEITKPKDEHIDQATYYASRLKADGILIVYLAKDLSEDSYKSESIWNVPIKAFEVSVEQEIIDSISEKTKRLWDTLEKGKLKFPEDPEKWLPPREYTPDDAFTECKFCSFAYTCYKNHPKILEENAAKFKEQSKFCLPVAEGKAFKSHSETEWGKDAAKLGKVEDKHCSSTLVIE